MIRLEICHFSDIFLIEKIVSTAHSHTGGDVGVLRAAMCGQKHKWSKLKKIKKSLSVLQ